MDFPRSVGQFLTSQASGSIFDLSDIIPNRLWNVSFKMINHVAFWFLPISRNFMGTDLFLQFYGQIHLIESKLEYRNTAVCHLSVYLLKLSFENFFIYQLAVNTVVGFEEGVCHETTHRECPGCSLKCRFCTDPPQPKDRDPVALFEGHNRHVVGLNSSHLSFPIVTTLTPKISQLARNVSPV